jgi:hypothetical protein
MKTGKQPDGSVIVVMPFEALDQENEVDLARLHAFQKPTGAQRGRGACPGLPRQ